MSITFVGSAFGSSATLPGSIDCSGIAANAGDLAVVFMVGTTISEPNGLVGIAPESGRAGNGVDGRYQCRSLVKYDPTGYDTMLSCWTRRLDSTDFNAGVMRDITFTWKSGSVAAAVVVYRGQHGRAFDVETVRDTNAALPRAGSDITTVTDGAWVVSCTVARDATPVAALSMSTGSEQGFTERVTGEAEFASGHALIVTDKQIDTAGAVTPPTIESAGGALQSVVTSIAIKPGTPGEKASIFDEACFYFNPDDNPALAEWRDQNASPFRGDTEVSVTRDVSAAGALASPPTTTVDGRTLIDAPGTVAGYQAFAIGGDNLGTAPTIGGPQYWGDCCTMVQVGARQNAGDHVAYLARSNRQDGEQWLVLVAGDVDTDANLVRCTYQGNAQAEVGAIYAGALDLSDGGLHVAVGTFSQPRGVDDLGYMEVWVDGTMLATGSGVVGIWNNRGLQNDMGIGVRRESATQYVPGTFGVSYQFPWVLSSAEIALITADVYDELTAAQLESMFPDDQWTVPGGSTPVTPAQPGQERPIRGRPVRRRRQRPATPPAGTGGRGPGAPPGQGNTPGPPPAPPPPPPAEPPSTSLPDSIPTEDRRIIDDDELLLAAIREAPRAGKRLDG